MSVRVPVWVPSFDEVMKDRPASAAEEALLAACRTDGLGWAGDECPADSSDPERAVRAGLIRFLWLGGDEGHRPHPKGVRVHGAWIEGALDFEGCETHLDLTLFRCLLPERPVFMDAQIGGLYLSGSRALQGCDLQRTAVETNVFLGDGFHSTGTVDLAGAAITGQLACLGGRFEWPEGVALNADGATIGAGAFLSGQFHATGEVNLVGATITGQLACTGGRFERPGGVALNANAATVRADVFLNGGFYATGEVNFARAAISGQLACVSGRFERPGGMALTADAATVGADLFLSDGFHATGVVNLTRARIEGHLIVQDARIDGAVRLHSTRIGEGFFWQEVKGEIPGMDLTEAKAGALHDDAQSWDRVKDRLKLDGFQYDAMHSAMTIRERLALLNRNDKPPFQILPAGLAETAPWLPTTDKRVFSPLAHTQLAKVLLAKGRRAEAAKALFARERRLRKTEWLRARARLDGSWKIGWRSVGADLQRFGGLWFRWLYGYGLRPWRALFWVIGYWLFATWFFSAIFAAGEFAPNSDVVLTSADWRRAVELGCPLAGEAGFGEAKAAGCVMPQDIWTSGLPGAVPPVPASTAAGDYETFSARLYAADLFLPLDTIGQTEAWAPSKDRGGVGGRGLLGAVSDPAVRLDHGRHGGGGAGRGDRQEGGVGGL